MTITDEQILEQAAAIIAKRFHREEFAATDPDIVYQYLTYAIGGSKNEIFAAFFLDNRHQLIAFEELFRGTVDAAAVYPRTVVQRAMELNASALILAHNHPSGISEPSQADRAVTRRLKDACSLLDIGLLDHLVIGCESYVSFARRGLI